MNEDGCLIHAVYLKRNYFTRPEKEDQSIYTENEILCQLEPPTTSSYDRDIIFPMKAK